VSEIVFGIRTVRNPGFLRPELTNMAMDHRYTTAEGKIRYAKSPQFMEKRFRLGSTMPEFATVQQIGLLVPSARTHKVHIWHTANFQPTVNLPNLRHYSDGTEVGLLRTFWKNFAKHFDVLFQHGQGDPLVGHNMIRGSLPFLLKRGSVLGIVPTREIRIRNEYHNPTLYDIGQRWDNRSHPSTELDILAKTFGVENYDPEQLGSELETVWKIYQNMKPNLV